MKLPVPHQIVCLVPSPFFPDKLQVLSFFLPLFLDPLLSPCSRSRSWIAVRGLRKMMYPVDGEEDTYQHSKRGVRPRPPTLQRRPSPLSKADTTSRSPPVLAVSILLAACVGALLYVGIKNSSFDVGPAGQVTQHAGATTPLSQYLDSFEEGTKKTGRLEGEDGVLGQELEAPRLFERQHPHGVNLNLNYHKAEEVFGEHGTQVTFGTYECRNNRPCK